VSIQETSAPKPRGKNHNPAADLAKQAEAAQTLIEHLRALGADDDEQTVADSIEGETGFFEALAEAVRAVGEDEALAEATKAYEEKLASRRQRIERRAEAVRAAIGVAMETAGVKQRETAYGTVSLAATQPKVIVTEEADIPSKYWKPKDPTLDKKALKADLDAKIVVPGAYLSNGGTSVKISKS